MTATRTWDYMTAKVRSWLCESSFSSTKPTHKACSPCSATLFNPEGFDLSAINRLLRTRSRVFPTSPGCEAGFLEIEQHSARFMFFVDVGANLHAHPANGTAEPPVGCVVVLHDRPC